MLGKISGKIKDIGQSLFNVAPHERIKVLLLTLAYFCIVAGYTVAKELKDTVFTSIVGSDYIPQARIAAMFILIPAILFYAILVDRIRRYQLLMFYCTFFGIGAFVFAYFLSHPIIGMTNTQQSPYRIFGWLFYFFLEAYTPFVISVFWAFSNSITDQDSAKKNYGLMVAGSKVGGMVGAGIGIIFLIFSTRGVHVLARDVLDHQILLSIFGMFCLAVPLLVRLLMKKVPGRFLHGYKAVYELEKKRSKEHKSKTGIFAGLAMLVKHPYVMGIFGIIFFYEIINSILSFQRVKIAQTHAIVSDGFSSSAMSLYLLKVVFFVHFIGFWISLLGTRTLLDKLGEKGALILIPVLNVALMIYLFVVFDPMAFMVVSVLAKSINYALGYPLRERLYIPTPKEIKFKAKSWNDAFGGKFGKSAGSTFNHLALRVSAAASFGVHVVFIAAISLFWLIAAFLLGKTFERTVKRNEVIGANSDPDAVGNCSKKD